MRLVSLQLEEFRGYRHAAFELPAPGLRLFGANAAGKTSILEAIYLLATMRSPRASLDAEMINWESGQEYQVAPYARVVADLETEERAHRIEISISQDVEGSNAARKRVRLDGRGRRVVDVVGTLKVVLFTPEDLSLVLGSPSVRRRYLDISISLLDPAYIRALSRFNRVLEQRNSLLKDLARRRAGSSGNPAEELQYWDGEIVTYGSYIIAARLRYVAGLSRRASEEFEQLSLPGSDFSVEYRSTLPLSGGLIDRITEGSEPDAQVFVSRAFEAALLERRDDELRRGVTLIGPHRDDIAFELAGHDLASFGSRGQQRLGVVATKLAELYQVSAISSEQPVLLLDDVLSELDPIHQKRLLDAVAAAGCQMVITATDKTLLDQPLLQDLPFTEAEGGAVTVEPSATHD
ncbi:MAG TPA: DNA replication/repair protein RecF [Thermomicrobiaceae bacterium]|nr:DNA replication/repair protein RecF [Thermomicrobiaceae bacterium]